MFQFSNIYYIIRLFRVSQVQFLTSLKMSREKKTKSIEELPHKTLHLLINIGKRNVMKNKYLHKNCRKIVERKYLTCYASISFSLIVVSQWLKKLANSFPRLSVCVPFYWFSMKSLSWQPPYGSTNLFFY